jgi:hypothetical protein
MYSQLKPFPSQIYNSISCDIAHEQKLRKEQKLNSYLR